VVVNPSGCRDCKPKVMIRLQGPFDCPIRAGLAGECKAYVRGSCPTARNPCTSFYLDLRRISLHSRYYQPSFPGKNGKRVDCGIDAGCQARILIMIAIIMSSYAPRASFVQQIMASIYTVAVLHGEFKTRSVGLGSLHHKELPIL
jgi:hypothetical protein